MSTFSWTIPSVSGTSLAQEDAITRENGRLFGTDLFFENDFSVTAQGDYLLLSGLENLRAAIYRRLLTRPGEYKFVPEYGVGIKSFLKRKTSVEVIDELRTAITEQLLRERRIDSVEKVAIDIDGNEVNVGLIIRAAGRALRFRPFTFSEEQ